MYIPITLKLCQHNCDKPIHGSFMTHTEMVPFMTHKTCVYLPCKYHRYNVNTKVSATRAFIYNYYEGFFSIKKHYKHYAVVKAVHFSPHLLCVASFVHVPLESAWERGFHGPVIRRNSGRSHQTRSAIAPS